jgi:hypothetical protein
MYHHNFVDYLDNIDLLIKVIEKKEYKIICSMVALLLKNMRALLKKSIMRYRRIKVMVIIANNLLNS